MAKNIGRLSDNGLDLCDPCVVGHDEPPEVLHLLEGLGHVLAGVLQPQLGDPAGGGSQVEQILSTTNHMLGISVHYGNVHGGSFNCPPP